MPDGQEADARTTEAVEATWWYPAEALDGARRGDLRLMPPTRHTLEEMAEQADVASVMAAAQAVDDICTREALAEAEAVNVRALQAIDAIIDEYELPAHTVGLGVKGCVTWSTTPVRNYRDYKATDFALAELSWLWGVNRHILTPPGLDEQWLVSLVTTDADMATLVDDFRELAQALRA